MSVRYLGLGQAFRGQEPKFNFLECPPDSGRSATLVTVGANP